MNSRFLGLFCGGFLFAASAAGSTTFVDIINFGFSPQDVTVRVGYTVSWTEKDSTIHTTTSCPNGVEDGLWNSGNLSFGQTFSFTFSSPGTFPYFCIPHRSFMRGT